MVEVADEGRLKMGWRTVTTEKKEEAIKKGCFIDAVLIAFEQKLSAYGIEQTYLHR